MNYFLKLHAEFVSVCGLLLRTVLVAGFSILLAACGGGTGDYSSQTDVGESDVSEPDVAEPDVAEPDVAEPDVGQKHPYVGANSVGSVPETISQRASTGLTGQAPGEHPLATAEERSAQALSIARDNLQSNVEPSAAPSTTFKETSLSASACRSEPPGEKLRFVVAAGPTATWQDLVNGARQIISCLEHERGGTVQWYASITLQGNEHVAVVNIVAIGKVAAAANADGYFPRQATQRLGQDERQGIQQSNQYGAAAGGLEGEDRKRALCLGGTAATYTELRQQFAAYINETEALALGMPSGTSEQALDDKRAELKAEESLLTDAEYAARVDARVAIRDKRISALKECIDRQKL
jgi:hypothetical protein